MILKSLSLILISLLNLFYIFKLQIIGQLHWLFQYHFRFIHFYYLFFKWTFNEYLPYVMHHSVIKIIFIKPPSCAKCFDRDWNWSSEKTEIVPAFLGLSYNVPSCWLNKFRSDGCNNREKELFGWRARVVTCRLV